MVAILLTLTACSSAPEIQLPAPTLTVSQKSSLPTTSPSPESSEPEPVYSSKPAESLPPASKKEHILIAYFTWAENTHVDDPDSVDVDATTSASVLLS
ncbi:hypothetical protein D7X94_10300 [Acutalibacter sp. 1XD8-33]|nr:hypothetical protein D7X94_10300 [Acutalibacter sp. 1XD8-33]